MRTWQEVARQALDDAYPETVSPGQIIEAIRKASILAWTRNGVYVWLRHQSDIGMVEHVSFKQYRAVKEEPVAEQPGKYAAPQVEAHLREDPDLGGLVVRTHIEYPNSSGAPYERHVPNLEAALGYIGTFWMHSAPGRDAAVPPSSGIEWGYRYRLLKHPLGGHGRDTERCSASRAEAEEDVAAFLEEPGKWAAEVIWRKAEVKPGEWHSVKLSVTDALDEADAAEEDGEELSPQVLSDLLSLAGDGTVIPPEVIATWAPRERLAAGQWAAAEHLSASDNPVKRLPKPTLVKRAEAICGSPAIAQLAVEAWAVFKEQGEFTAGWEDVYAVAQDAMTGLLVLLRGAGRTA